MAKTAFGYGGFFIKNQADLYAPQDKSRQKNNMFYTRTLHGRTAPFLVQFFHFTAAFYCFFIPFSH